MPPIVEMLDVWTSRAPIARAAASTLRVPPTFDRVQLVAVGDERVQRRRRGRSRRIPRPRVHRVAIAQVAVHDLDRARHRGTFGVGARPQQHAHRRRPCASSVRATAPPMNPLAPVTSAFTRAPLASERRERRRERGASRSRARGRARRARRPSWTSSSDGARTAERVAQRGPSVARARLARERRQLDVERIDDDAQRQPRNAGALRRRARSAQLSRSTASRPGRASARFSSRVAAIRGRAQRSRPRRRARERERSRAATRSTARARPRVADLVAHRRSRAPTSPGVERSHRAPPAKPAADHEPRPLLGDHVRGAAADADRARDRASFAEPAARRLAAHLARRARARRRAARSAARPGSAPGGPRAPHAGSRTLAPLPAALRLARRILAGERDVRDVRDRDADPVLPRCSSNISTCAGPRS